MRNAVEVTWVHAQGYKFVQRYTSIKRFITSYRRGTYRLDNAVVHSTMEVVDRNNIKEFISKYA